MLRGYISSLGFLWIERNYWARMMCVTWQPRSMLYMNVPEESIDLSLASVGD